MFIKIYGSEHCYMCLILTLLDGVFPYCGTCIYWPLISINNISRDQWNQPGERLRFDTTVAPHGGREETNTTTDTVNCTKHNSRIRSLLVMGRNCIRAGRMACLKCELFDSGMAQYAADYQTHMHSDGDCFHLLQNLSILSSQRPNFTNLVHKPWEPP